MNFRSILTTLLFLAPAAYAELKTDIEFAKPGGVSLTLDAFVPDGAGPFATCILVHSGGFTKGDKTSFIKPLFEPLSKAGFVWCTIIQEKMKAVGNTCDLITISGGGHGMGGWDKLESDYAKQMIEWLRKTLR